MNFDGMAHPSYTLFCDMRKFLLSIVSLVVLSALVTGSLTGCADDKQQSDTLSDTTVIAPVKSAEPGDGLEVLTAEGELEDVSKSMVILTDDSGNSVEFTYGDYLDKDNPEVYDELDVDNPSKIKVSYVKVKHGDVMEDSVISIHKVD